MRELLASDPVTYVEDFVNPESAKIAFDTLRSELDWERRPDAPRSEYWTNTLGRSYTYGRGAGVRTYESKPSHGVISLINHSMMLGFKAGQFDAALLCARDHAKIETMFEGCFLNMYENSRDSLGWHADDDPGIDHTRPIAVVTLGEGRPLRIRPIDNLHDVAEVFLKPGSLLLMHAGMQDTHHHSIPKVGYECGPRISLTYRGLKTDG